MKVWCVFVEVEVYSPADEFTPWDDTWKDVNIMGVYSSQEKAREAVVRNCAGESVEWCITSEDHPEYDEWRKHFPDHRAEITYNGDRVVNISIFPRVIDVDSDPKQPEMCREAKTAELV